MLNLDEYPWEKITPYRKIAEQYKGELIDLSIGSPVDSTPKIIQEALNQASNAHSYPLTSGSYDLRQSIAKWWREKRQASLISYEHVFPTIGSKEIIAWLPTILGLKSSDVVVYPEIAYPTYLIGAQIASCKPYATSDIDNWPDNTKLVWINTPSNPTGEVLSKNQLRNIISKAREIGAYVVSDECYAELNWKSDNMTISLLSDSVCDKDYTKILSLYSLSKQSNMAGYRSAFAAGDRELVQSIVNIRKHAGMIVPNPIQNATITALIDYKHVKEQREIYYNRRNILVAALRKAGYDIDHSEAGLYLWVSNRENCWLSLEKFARKGILVAPGSFYGSSSDDYLRIALTATTKNVEEAAQRIISL